MKDLKLTLTILIGSALVGTGVTYAQDCLVPKPTVAPKAWQVVVRFPNPDGGSRPCLGLARAASGQPSNEYQMSNADCDRLKRLGDWAVEQDNGFADGGVP